MLRESQPELRDPRTPGGLGRRHPGGCSPAPPSRRAPGSPGAKRGCARGAAEAEGQVPEAGRGYPLGEDGHHAGLAGQRLTDRTFFNRTLFN